MQIYTRSALYDDDDDDVVEAEGQGRALSQKCSLHSCTGGVSFLLRKKNFLLRKPPLRGLPGRAYTQTDRRTPMMILSVSLSRSTSSACISLGLSVFQNLSLSLSLHCPCSFSLLREVLYSSPLRPPPSLPSSPLDLARTSTRTLASSPSFSKPSAVLLVLFYSPSSSSSVCGEALSLSPSLPHRRVELPRPYQPCRFPR